MLNKVISCQTASAYIVKCTYIPKLLKIYKKTQEKYLNKDVKITHEECNDQSWKILQKKDVWHSFILGTQIKSYSNIETKIVNYKV